MSHQESSKPLSTGCEVSTSDTTPYAPNLRYAEFSFHKGNEKYAYDLVVDDEFLQQGDAPVNLQFLASTDSVAREFTLMTLQGQELRSALPAILVQAVWDPSTEVRLQAIEALGRIARGDEHTTEEFISIQDTLQQIYKSPHMRPPEATVLQGEHSACQPVPSMSVSLDNADVIRCAVLKTLTQLPAEAAWPSPTTLFSVYRSLTDAKLREDFLSIIDERLGNISDWQQQEELITSLLEQLTALPIQEGSALCTILSKYQPAVVEYHLQGLVFRSRGQESMKLLQLFVEHVGEESEVAQSCIDRVFLSHPSHEARCFAASQGVTESCVLRGLDSRSDDIRDLAIDTLIAQGVSEEGLEQLVSRLRLSSHRNTQLASARTLSHLSSTTAVAEQLVLALEHPNDIVAHHCAIALSHSGDLTHALSVAEEMLRNPFKERKAPYMEFLNCLEPGQTFIPQALFDAVGTFIEDRVQRTPLRQLAVNFVVDHATEYQTRELLTRIRPRVNEALQEYIDRALE
ncbi:MAG: HEAT repeat domain-containing protein [Bdellovibrionota bacterium]